MTIIQKKMFAELKDSSIFENAVKFGFDYTREAFERNVYPTEEAVKNLDAFREDLPTSGTDSYQILNQLEEFGRPATVTQVGGRFFGFVCGSYVPSGLAAKLLASFWDQNPAMYVQSPIAATLETVVQDWLKKIFNLPDSTVAGFVSGTSSANMCGLAAGRYRLLKNKGWDVNQKGFNQAPPIRVITGAETHSTILKASGLIGIGRENIQFIDTDDQGRIKAELVPELDNNTLLILQAGNVNSGSFDDFATLCAKARKAGAWVHIDGAFGLWAAASERLAYLTKGMELANSWAVDGHKTLNTPYDSGIILCADGEALSGALSMSAGYIVAGPERNGMTFTPEMSRRSRIFDLWATIKFLGTEGIDEMITEMHVRAKQFEKELKKIEGFEVLNDVVFNQVVVTCETDDLTNEVLKNIQDERVCWVGGSTWRGRKVIRISVCSWATTQEDVTLSVASFRSSLLKALTIQSHAS